MFALKDKICCPNTEFSYTHLNLLGTFHAPVTELPLQSHTSKTMLSEDIELFFKKSKSMQNAVAKAS
jgi:hypothetical protein